MSAGLPDRARAPRLVAPIDRAPPSAGHTAARVAAAPRPAARAQAPAPRVDRQPAPPRSDPPAHRAAAPRSGDARRRRTVRPAAPATVGRATRRALPQVGLLSRGARTPGSRARPLRRAAGSPVPVSGDGRRRARAGGARRRSGGSSKPWVADARPRVRRSGARSGRPRSRVTTSRRAARVLSRAGSPADGRRREPPAGRGFGTPCPANDGSTGLGGCLEPRNYRGITACIDASWPEHGLRVTGVSSLEQASGAGSLRSKKEGGMQRKFTVSGTIGLVVLVVALSAGTALASGTPPQGLEADGLRLQAVAQAYGQTEGSTPLGLQADGLRLQGIAQAYGQTEGSTPQGHEADGLRLLWIARAYQDH